ncbi:glycosyltransferase family 8 protein [Karstenula rhodostoma CBS 690.94]|uniref:Glycosyltransferase family 8 protein n=1 Tax=Karstenula rhodostoma CBS 690.94 TaxID=1392251 RepID=A0A9P4PBE4_9PLEO|nr:glycosyltransferase family 8 protein [Karstenula rhodostoma CBS 690.94]
MNTAQSSRLPQSAGYGALASLSNRWIGRMQHASRKRQCGCGQSWPFVAVLVEPTSPLFYGLFDATANPEGAATREHLANSRSTDGIGSEQSNGIPHNITMFWRRKYSPLATEEVEGGMKSPVKLSNWLLLRRVRAAIVAAILLLLLGVVIFQYPNLNERVRGYAQEATASAPAVCNCAATETIAAAPDGDHEKSSPTPSIKWSDFAYVQYVTNPSYLCNSLMIFEALRRYNTKADLLMMYPEQWALPPSVDSKAGNETKLLVQARDVYKARMAPIQIQTFENEKDPTWQDSYTKLLAFNQTQYKRVMSIDSDGTLLDHMDELFVLPPAPVAMPRAYWMPEKFFLSSQLIVIEPSEAEWRRVEYAMGHHEGYDYDMDILNKIFGKSSTVIPHRRYDLLSGEFHNTKHEDYLGSPDEKWDPKKALDEAKFVHFSDWPMPKPWLEPLPGMVEENQPECRKVSSETEDLDCTDREVWLGIRKDFTERRKRICGREYDAEARPTSKRGLVDAVIERPFYEPVFD